MKKGTALLIIISLLLISVLAQDKLYIFKVDKSVVPNYISAIDSIFFSENDTKLNIVNTDKTETSFLLSEIDSITFTNPENNVKIEYNGTNATVTNPYESAGVSVTVTGASVVVNSTLSATKINYELSGATTNGMFKIYSNSDFELQLNNVTITNPSGPAINIQSKYKASVLMLNETQNTLSDGSSYTTSSEDQKSTLFSEGTVQFLGGGSLTISSVAKHAICSDETIVVSGGKITIPSAGKDGIHSKGLFSCNAGQIETTTTGDGIECELGNLLISGGNITTTNAVADTKGITCDYNMTISGGSITQNLTGNQTKGLRAKLALIISGGNINTTLSGAAVLTALGLGYDPSYCTAMKATGIDITGGSISVNASGTGNKAISSDANLTVSSGAITVISTTNGAIYTNSLGVADAYSFAALDADGEMRIIGGSITSTTSGTGSRVISCDGNLIIGSSLSKPVIKITNSSERFLVSGTANYTTAIYCEPKGIKSDGIITIHDADMTITSSKQASECIDTDSVININGGTLTLTANGNQSKAIKATKELNINGGKIGITTTGGVVFENLTATTYDPSYCSALKSDANITISNGEVVITASGAGAKGLSADSNINITGGSIKVTVSGTGTTYSYNALSAKDSYNSTCITADGNVTILAGTVNLTTTSTAAGGKGISANGTVVFGDASNAPVINITTAGSRFLVSGTDYSHPKTLVSDNDITINNGIIVINSTDDGIHSEKSVTLNGGNTTISAISSTQGVGEGVEAPLIYFKGGTNKITASNDGVNATYGTQSGGTESNDNSHFYISGGTHFINATSGDAIDSNGNITMTGGFVFANGPLSGMEEAADFNGAFNMNGGTFIGAGSSSNMTKAMNTTSTQPNFFVSSSSSISSSTLMTVAVNGTSVITFKPLNGAYKFLISCPQMVKGASYAIYTGGSYTGGTILNNYYSGGTFSSSGATTKKTGTLSSSSTLNSISF